jgi:hypothetical protein
MDSLQNIRAQKKEMSPPIKITKRLEKCNAVKKRDTDQMIKFASKKSQTNLVKWRDATARAGKYRTWCLYCCVMAGHMLVLHMWEYSSSAT